MNDGDDDDDDGSNVPDSLGKQRLEGEDPDDVLSQLLQQVNRLHQADLDTKPSLSSSAALEVERLVIQLHPDWFDQNPERMEVLLQLCRQDASGRVLIVATEVFLAVNCQEEFPSLFDALVKLLWSLISGDDHVNSSRFIRRRILACESLREIELGIPGSLETLVRVKEGQDRSKLAQCVMEERSHAFQSYLLLFLTILSQQQQQTEALTSSSPSSLVGHFDLDPTRISAIGLVVESLPLMSKYARADALSMAAQILVNHRRQKNHATNAGDDDDDDSTYAILHTLAQHGLDSLGYSSSAIAVLALTSVGDELSPADKVAFTKRMAVSIANVIRDDRSDASLRVFAAGMMATTLATKDKQQLCPIATTFDDLTVSVAVVEAVFECFRNDSNPTRLLELCWFCEDFHRERSPSVVTAAAFRLYKAFLRYFPQCVDQVAHLLVQGALLRGGPRFFTPISVLADLSSGKKDVHERLVAVLSDAVLDVPHSADIAGFFPLLEQSFIVVSKKKTTSRDHHHHHRALMALERYLSGFTYSFSRWQEAMGFVECCRIAMDAFPRGDPSLAFVRRLVKILLRRVSDPVLRDECALLRSSSASSLRAKTTLSQSRTIESSSSSLYSKPLSVGRIIASLSSPARSTTTTTQQYQSQFDHLRRDAARIKSKLEIIPMDQILSLERIIPDIDPDASLGDVLTLQLRLRWIVTADAGDGDPALKELFALRIHIVDSRSALESAFNDDDRSRPFPVISVPYIASSGSEQIVSIALKPSFPAPVRIALRGMATTANGEVVEGPLQDIRLEFVDWWRVAEDSSTTTTTTISPLPPPSEYVAIVREQVERPVLNAFLTKTRAGRYFTPLSAGGGDHDLSGCCWEANVIAKPSHRLQFKIEYFGKDKRAVIHARVDHWVLLSYLDEVFQFGR